MLVSLPHVAPAGSRGRATTAGSGIAICRRRRSLRDQRRELSKPGPRPVTSRRLLASRTGRGRRHYARGHPGRERGQGLPRLDPAGRGARPSRHRARTRGGSAMNLAGGPSSVSLTRPTTPPHFAVPLSERVRIGRREIGKGPGNSAPTHPYVRSDIDSRRSHSRTAQVASRSSSL
jgi:hypothetical protein